MVGIRLIVIMAIVGGLIAYIADKMGSKIGKKKMTIFGLRPKYTSILLTVLSGVLISVLSIVTVTISSESARTALFGMDKLQKELKSLNDEKGRVAEALIEASGKVQKQNETIAALDKEIKNSTNAKEKMEFELASMNAKYDSAQEEVKNLSDARVKLTNEISDLEKTTEGLRQGIINMREGQLYYRAGEVVYAAVLRGAMNIEQNKDQVAWLLNNANQAALQRLGDQMPDKPVQVIWISEEFVTDALNVLNKNKGDYLCRVRTIANIMVGELVVCELEMLQNKLIYNDEEEVMTKTYDFSNGKVNPDMVIMDFLTGVNHKAVAAGVLPDPVTGKVGNLDAEVMVLAANQIKNCNGKFTLTAYTRGKVTTAGPVRIGLRVKQEKKYE